MKKNYLGFMLLFLFLLPGYSQSKETLNRADLQRWVFQPGDSIIMGPPLAEHGVVCFTYYRDGLRELSVFNSRTGDELWSVLADERRSPSFSTFAVFNNSIFFNQPGATMIEVDKDSGRELYSIKGLGPAFVSTDSVIIGEYNEYIYYGGGDDLDILGYVWASDKTTGEELWKMELGLWNILNGNPIIVGHSVYFLAGSIINKIYSVDVKEGNILWSKEIGGPGEDQSFTVIYDKLLVMSYSGKITALDKSNGYRKWTTQLEDVIRAFSNPYRNSVIIRTDNYIYSLDLDTGQKNWVEEYTKNRYSNNDLQVEFDTLYLASGPHLIAIKALTGEELWRLEMEGTIRYEPSLDEGYLYVTMSWDWNRDRLYALEIPYFEDRIGILNDSDVRIRSEPNLDGKKLGKLMNGDRVKIIQITDEKMKIGNMNDYWYEIITEDGFTGWAYGFFIDIR